MECDVLAFFEDAILVYNNLFPQYTGYFQFYMSLSIFLSDLEEFTNPMVLTLSSRPPLFVFSVVVLKSKFRVHKETYV